MAVKEPGGVKKWWSTVRQGFWRHWIDFSSDLWRMLKAPLGQPPFIFYFLGIIVIVGGLGVSLSISEGINAGTLVASTAVPRSLSTFLLAILATAFVDLSMHFEAQAKRSLKMFALFTLVLGTVGGTIALLTSNIKMAYSSAVAGSLLALLLWWIANSANEKLFEPNPSPTASLGENLQEMPGTLEGFQT
jgi:membrane associated rhomboid family serine protease